MRQPTLCFLFPILLIAKAVFAQAPEPNPQQQFLSFIKQQADELRAADKVPPTREAWDAHRTELRRQLLKAWGGFPTEACPLEPRILGTLKRDGYRVENVIFQTRPGVWMTANAYVPDGPGKHPAILQVHGHWRGAAGSIRSYRDAASARPGSASLFWSSTLSVPANAASVRPSANITAT